MIKMSKPKVEILMSTYNGEKYLSTQLESIFSQKEVDISILVRDDGSHDDTIRILEAYSQKYPIKIVTSENIGYANSFWDLVHMADGADYYAFCDQDDIWMEDKVLSAVKMISSCGKIPVLYTSNVDTINDELQLLQRNAFPVNGVQNFRQSLLTSILPGCTFVFNNMLLLQMKKYNRLVISHDWLTYSIASAVGVVLYDEHSHINYRIHENNTLGIQRPLEKFKVQIHNFFYPKYKNGRSVVSKNINEIYKQDMTKKDEEVARLFGNYRHHYYYIFKLLKYKEFRNAILDILLFLKKA